MPAEAGLLGAACLLNLRRIRHTSSRQRLDIVDGLLRFGASLVIRIDIGRTNDAAAVDHEPSRHRQGPADLAVAYREVIAKAEISRLQIIGQFEPQTVSPADVIYQSERARARKGKLSSIR
jgi:hypothetical protein